MSNLPAQQNKSTSLVTRDNAKTAALVVGGVAALAVALPVITGTLGILWAIMMLPLHHPFFALLAAGGVYWGVKKNK